PMMIESKSVDVSAPTGWRGIYGPSGVRTLEGAQAIFTATDSLQEAWGELKDPPSTRKKGGAVIEVRYPLPDEQEYTKWVVCHYGDRLYQALKLPPATKACIVTNHRKIDPHTKKPVYRVADITCR
ncbi:MAG TPA: STY0301 family protein, partial [Telluria sp.]|nr:STY0301 family protein [Telluria sp.]